MIERNPLRQMVRGGVNYVNLQDLRNALLVPICSHEKFSTPETSSAASSRYFPPVRASISPVDGKKGRGWRGVAIDSIVDNCVNIILGSVLCGSSEFRLKLGDLTHEVARDRLLTAFHRASDALLNISLELDLAFDLDTEVKAKIDAVHISELVLAHRDMCQFHANRKRQKAKKAAKKVDKPVAEEKPPVAEEKPPVAEEKPTADLDEAPTGLEVSPDTTPETSVTVPEETSVSPLAAAFAALESAVGTMIANALAEQSERIDKVSANNRKLVDRVASLKISYARIESTLTSHVESHPSSVMPDSLDSASDSDVMLRYFNWSDVAKLNGVNTEAMCLFLCEEGLIFKEKDVWLPNDRSDCRDWFYVRNVEREHGFKGLQTMVTPKGFREITVLILPHCKDLAKRIRVA